MHIYLPNFDYLLNLIIGIAVGNPPVNASLVDLDTMYTIIDEINWMTYPGRVTKWEFYASETGRSITFSIFRPTGTSAQYEAVYQHVVSAGDVVSGLNQVILIN